MHHIRLSVTENILSRPDLVTPEHYREMITTRGKGWVCVWDDQIVGFAIADLQENNVWALFVLPQYENRGIGRELQKRMLDWYFSKTTVPICLGTDPHTRAERFYLNSGWKETGSLENGEFQFQMTVECWKKKNAARKRA